MTNLLEETLQSIFTTHYDFFERLTKNSSQCHNYMNHEALGSFTFLTGCIEGVKIVYESTCYIDDLERPVDHYDIEGGEFNPCTFIRTIITLQGIYCFNSLINSNKFTLRARTNPWQTSSMDI